MRKALAILALTAACTDQATAPRPGPPTITPSVGISKVPLQSSISNAPPQSGVVFRAGYPAILIFGVPSAGLEVAMHADAREFCQQYPDNIDPATWGIMTYADKVLFDRILTLGQASDVPTQVWSYGGESPESFCAMIAAGAQPLATGVTRGLQFFSDLDGTGNGADVMRWNYHGLLTRPDGGQAVFRFQMQWLQGAPTKVTASLR